MLRDVRRSSSCSQAIGETQMKKAAVAAVALTGVSVLTGAAVAPAATHTSGVKAAHTLKWRLTETASHNVGKNGFVGTDVIRSIRTGKIVGYDSTTGVYHPRTNAARIQVAASVKGGILVGQVHGRFTPDVVFHGRILKGTGKFAGAQGTITAQPVGDGTKTLVTIHYVD
jgi:hypothetical protein